MGLHLLGSQDGVQSKYNGLVKVNGRLNEQQTEVDRDGKLYLVVCTKVSCEKIETKIESIHAEQSRDDMNKEKKLKNLKKFKKAEEQLEQKKVEKEQQLAAKS